MSGAGNPDISTLPIMPPSTSGGDGFMSQGYEGYGPSAPGLTPAAPWTTGNASSNQLAKALQSLGAAQKAGQSSGQPTYAPTPQNAPVGHPNRPTSISPLIDFLQNQREGYLKSAMGAPGTARPVTMPLHTGLLGF